MLVETQPIEGSVEVRPHPRKMARFEAVDPTQADRWAAAEAQVHALRTATAAEDTEILFPYTPRHNASWFDKDPAVELVDQCLRPGHCGLPEGEERDWLHMRLVQLGHASKEWGEPLMALTWFECSYAAKPRAIDLMLSVDMRLKLGQLSVVEQLYSRIIGMETTSALRSVAERKLSEVIALRSSQGSASSPAWSPNAELPAVLSAPVIVNETLASADTERMLVLLRVCGFAATKVGDFEAAHRWFDCSFALSSSTEDLLSGANMRRRIDPNSPAAAEAYQLVLRATNPPPTPPVEPEGLGSMQIAEMLQRLEERITSGFESLANSQLQGQLQNALVEHASATRMLCDQIASLKDTITGTPLGSPAVSSFSAAQPYKDSSPVPRALSPSNTSDCGTGDEVASIFSEKAKSRLSVRHDTLDEGSGISDPGKRSWALLESDPDVSVMLKDVRGKLDEYAKAASKKQPTVADLEAEGTLFVQLLRAKGLLAADANGLSDPYAKLSLGEQNQRSRKMRRTLDPVWHNEVFAFSGVLGHLIRESLKLDMWDFDLWEKDDLLGHVDIDLLGDHTYCNEMRRDLTAQLDTQGQVMIQVWWEPEGSGADTGGGGRLRRSATNGGNAKSTWRRLLGKYLCYLVPKQLQTFKGCCKTCCIRVLHPDSKFRATWNVALAFFILYAAQCLEFRA